jgi:oligoribonuclease
MIWVDIETTGLDPLNDTILEVGFCVTDTELKVVSEFDVLIWDAGSQTYVDKADTFVKKMHGPDGTDLFRIAKEEGIRWADAERALLGWMAEVGVTKDDPLCGSSVHFDRGFLKDQLDTIESQFSHRNIDNSTIKELCRRYNPNVYASVDEFTHPKKLHRAMPDLADTIEEHGFYMDNFLWVAAR